MLFPTFRLFHKFRLFPIIALVTTALWLGAFPTDVLCDGNQKPLLRESSVNHRSATRRTLSQLSLYTDLWHMAVIRGNDKEAVRYQQTLATIVRSDIDATARLTRKFARRIALAGFDSSLSDPGRKTLATRFRRSLELLRSKMRLKLQFDRKHLSGNTSFLAGKYMDILRRQMGLEKIWLASAAASSHLWLTDD